MKLGFEEFNKAYKVLKKVIQPTPLVYNEWLSLHYDCKIYLKLENMLPIGSFKMRGATYKISTLTEKERKNGVLAVSAGNHAQGVAWAAHHFKTKATIIMPTGSPLLKIKNTESLGAKVILHGQNIEDCFSYAETLGKNSKMIFIHPFHDKEVILGQGSVGFELNEQFPAIDYLFSSIGGGGLVSGVGHVLKSLQPKCRIIAGQASGASTMVRSLSQNKILEPAEGDTFADGIRVKKANPEMMVLLKNVLTDSQAVKDERIAWAVLQLLEKAKVVAEGAGAVPLALFDQMYKKDPKKFKKKNIVLLICGGNIDVNLLERIIDRGLIESKRKIHLSISIKDQPGSLHTLTGMIKEEGANILHIVHDRNQKSHGITGTEVEFTLETKGEEHSQRLLKRIRQQFPDAMI